VAEAKVLRQEEVLRAIVERASAIDAIDGVIVIGSFAAGGADALSDLDLVVAAAPGRLDEAWEARFALAGDPFLLWEPQPNDGCAIRWVNWLTGDLVKVECGIAAPGSKELAEPFLLVSGSPDVVDRFPRIERHEIEARAKRRDDEQRAFDPDALTPEERLGWKLAEMKSAARDLRSARHQ
jgi:hypothetical protein